MSAETPAAGPSPATPADPVSAILDAARWAPSGDNTQPWRFQIVHRGDHASAGHIVIHGRDTRDHVVYDLQGHASQLAIGALLETLTIAASKWALRVDVARRSDAPETTPTFDVRLVHDPSVQCDSLYDIIPKRTTQRRAMSTCPLTATEKASLEAAVAPNFDVRWIEGTPNKKRVARLLFRNAHIRLTTQEAYLVHRDIIHWGVRFSEDRVPSQAIGLDPVATAFMKWAMKSWGRVQFMNRYFAGTLLPRLQLDYKPAMKCAAHFLIVAKTPPQSIDEFIAAGRAVQRFWLTTASIGLQFQPEMTPLIFTSYVRSGLKFTTNEQAWRNSQRLADELDGVVGADVAQKAVFMGRVGEAPAPVSRSIRLPLDRLMHTT